MANIKLSLRKVSPGNASENARLINYALESAKDGDHVYYPDGVIPLIDPIIQHNKTLYHFGTWSTQLKVVHAKGPGIVISRTRDTGRTKIENLELINDTAGDYPFQHGIECHVPVTIEEVTVKNFMGHGVYLTATKTAKDWSDASNALVRSLTIKSCRGDGLRIQGADANGGLFEQVRVSDCRGWGIADLSNFGNCYVACTNHLNRKGDYKAAGSSNCSNFYRCYSESGSSISVFAGWVQVYGGTWASGFVLGDYAAYHGSIMNEEKNKVVNGVLTAPYQMKKLPEHYLEEVKRGEV